MKKDLAQKLYSKKMRLPNPFLYFIYHVVGLSPLLGGKYHPKIEVVDKLPKKGPCFYIFNHQSRRDHTFIERAAWPRRISIVCEYNEFFRSHLHFALNANQIVPKKVFVNDIWSTKLMHSVIKQGGCLAFSPEGTSSIFGCNQPIVVGTGKFLKHYKIPVYCADIKGSYLTNNKIDERDRFGKVFLKQYLLFSPEDLEKLSPEEIEDKINEVFRQDDYEWNKEQRIKYNSKGHICDNLETICYQCPKCKSLFSMKAEGDKIWCEKCGNGAHMNDYYDFIPFDDSCIIPETPVKWMEMERVEIIKKIREDKDFSFTDKVAIGDLPKDHLIKHHAFCEECGEGDFTVDHTGAHFKGINHGKEWSYDWDYNTLYTFSIPVDLKSFALHPDQEFMSFIPKHNTTTYMMLLAQEMHRLHVNTWKAFPWDNWMYEGYDK